MVREYMRAFGLLYFLLASRASQFGEFPGLAMQGFIRDAVPDSRRKRLAKGTS